VRLLLDTVALIVATESPEKLGKAAAAAIRNEGNRLELSAISVTEIAIKNAKGNLRLPADTLKQALADLDAHILPYTEAHAYRFFELPFHHKDPFDRQIIAQALEERVPVITPDDTFRRYRGLKLIW
jgi:PIN domain nuclease of toxin-antitoxin system